MDLFSGLATVAGGLLGGLGSGGDQEATQTVEPWSRVQDNLMRLHPQAENVWNNMLPQYPGATYAPFNPLQVGGQFGMLDYAQNRFQPGVSTYQNRLMNMMNQGVADRPEVQAMMGANQRDVTRSLVEDWLPKARSSAAMAGQYGSSRQGIAEGMGIRGAAEGLANANAKTMMGAFNPVMAQQTATAGMMPNALNMGFQGPQTAMDIGGMQQAQFQQGINQARDRYYYPEQRSLGMLDWLNNIFTTSGGLGSSTTSTTPGASPLSGALGGAMTGYSIANNWNNTGSGGNTVNPNLPNMSSWANPQSTWQMFNPPTANSTYSW